MNADGREQQNLTKTDAEEMDPRWSPDGRRISFLSLREGGPGHYLMNADGTQLVRLAVGSFTQKKSKRSLGSSEAADR
jgi:Tol biopolymer transport system component